MKCFVYTDALITKELLPLVGLCPVAEDFATLKTNVSVMAIVYGARCGHPAQRMNYIHIRVLTVIASLRILERNIGLVGWGQKVMDLTPVPKGVIILTGIKIVNASIYDWLSKSSIYYQINGGQRMSSYTKPILSFSAIIIVLTMGVGLGPNAFWHHKSQQPMNQMHNLTVNSLPDHSIFIIDRSDTAFEKLFSAQVNVPQDMEDDIKRFSVFITNNSNRAIAAYIVKWEFLQPNGRVINDYRGYSQLKLSAIGTDDLHPALTSRSSRLLSLINGVASATKLLNPPSLIPEDKRGYIKNNLNNEISHLTKKLEKSVSWSVTLDSVLFTDGTLVGTDTHGYFEELKAQLEGRQDMFQEVLNIISNETPERTYADAFKHAEEIIGSGVPPLSGFAASDFYKRSKGLAAQEILTRRSRLGEQQAIEFVKNALSKPRFQLVKH